jgi:hypothetical protein
MFRDLSRSAVRNLAVQTAVLVAVLLLHHILREPHARLHILVLPILLFPVAYYSSVLGFRGALIAAVLSAFIIIDHIHDRHPTILAIEVAAIAGISAFGIAVASIANRETAADRMVREVSNRRLAELASQPGYWDKISVTRTGLYVNRLESEFIAHALGRRARGVTADIGAGSGRLYATIVPLSRVVVATEVNRSELIAMPSDPHVAPVLVGAMQTSIPLQSGAIDSIVCTEVPAVSEEDWFRLECTRVLQPAGVVVLTVYNALSYKGLIARLLRPLRSSRGIIWSSLYYRHTLSWHLSAWSRAGYRVRASKGLYWLPLPRGSDSVWVNVAAVLERMLGLRWLVGWSPWVMLELERDSLSGPSRSEVCTEGVTADQSKHDEHAHGETGGIRNLVGVRPAPPPETAGRTHVLCPAETQWHSPSSAA